MDAIPQHEHATVRRLVAAFVGNSRNRAAMLERLRWEMAFQRIMEEIVHVVSQPVRVRGALADVHCAGSPQASVAERNARGPVPMAAMR